MSELLLAGRWLLAIVLIVAGVSKLLAPTNSEVIKAFRDYGVIPERLIEPTAAALPWLEVMSGALLAIGIALVVTAGFVAVMMGLFAVAVGWHVAHGRRFGCGCGSGGSRISWWLAARDLALCVIAGAIAIGPGGALAAWPGWGSGGTTGSAVSMIPVPLATIAMLLGVRLVVSGRQAQRWRARLTAPLREA